jgi:hypothetical protein
MEQLDVPKVYTILAFGVSMLLWPYVSTVALEPSMEGVPRGLIHPFFTAELFLMMSTVFVWVTAMLISLYNLRKQRIGLTKRVIPNWFEFSLVLATIIVAVFGCIFYSEPFHYDLYPNSALGLWVDQGISPPNLFALVNGVGIILCEAAWIIIGLAKYLKHLGFHGNVSGPEAI